MIVKTEEHHGVLNRHGSVSHCWWLPDYNLGPHPWSGIVSYRNNLSVKATLWWIHLDDWNDTALATISPGSHSSDTHGGHFAFDYSKAICTGDAKPWNHIAL
ncbi:hypothetical protein [Streptomyces sp. NPDC059076]|uniref:hypothetical protein n=1 Tax=unclassified Streptomyces TaxID=2593676 RepID=UPI003679AD57